MSHSKKLIATGNSHGIIELWNYKRKRSFHILKGHIGAITHLTFSPDDQILFSSDQVGTVRIWNLSDGSFIKQINAHQNEIETLSIDYASKSLITISDGEAKVWDFRDCKLLKVLSHPKVSALLIALGHTGLFSICGFVDGSIYLHQTLKANKIQPIQAHAQAVQALDFFKKNLVFATGSSDGNVSLWQFPSGERRQTCQSAPSGVTALAFCHQGRLLCGADDQGHLMVWDVASGALLDTVSAHSPGRISLITVADDALLSAGADGAMRQWRF